MPAVTRSWFRSAWIPTTQAAFVMAAAYSNRSPAACPAGRRCRARSVPMTRTGAHLLLPGSCQCPQEQKFLRAFFKKRCLPLFNSVPRRRTYSHGTNHPHHGRQGRHRAAASREGSPGPSRPKSVASLSPSSIKNVSPGAAHVRNEKPNLQQITSLVCS